MSQVESFRYESGISTMGEQPLAIDTVSVSKEVDVNWACNSSTWEKMESTDYVVGGWLFYAKLGFPE